MNSITVFLRELCEFRHGNTPSKSDTSNWGGTFPWVSPKDMRSDTIFDTIDHISEHAVQSGKAAIASQGSILVVVRSGILAHTFPVAMAGRDVAFNQDLKSLRVTSPLLLPEFLFRFLQAKSSDVITRGTKKGATVHSLQSGFLESLEISLPPLDEQERIVKLLDEADKLWKLRAEADRRMGELVPAFFYEMFRNKEIPPAPIGELTSLVTSGATPRGGERVYVSEGPYFIRSQNVRMGTLDLTDVARIPVSTFDQMRRVSVEDGDVLLNITGASIGRVAMAKHLSQPAVISQHVSILRPIASRLLPEYLSTYLSLPEVQNRIMVEQSGASRQALNHKQIRAMTIPVPTIRLQHEFAIKLGSVKRLRQLQLCLGHEVESLSFSLLGQLVEFGS